MATNFEKAMQKVNELKNDPGNDAKLKLYGLFKQATVGKCNTSKPGMLDLIARSKWNAWNQLKNMSKEEAEKNYISYVNELYKAENLNLETTKTSEYSEIITSIEFNNVFKIVLNKPEKLNSISGKMYLEIISALNVAENNQNIALCVLTGNGDYFSSGNDLGNYTSQIGNENPEELIKRGCDLFESFINAFIKFSKPLIAFVNGPAIGAAFTILGLFDLIVASDKAFFYAPFTKIALSPEGCSSYTFTRLMGYSKASEILLFNRKLNAKEALERNLVNEVLPHSNASDTFWKKIETLSKINTTSIIESKQIIRKHDREILLNVNKQEMELLRKRLESGDFMEYVMLFMNRKSKL